jgi:hypothetical protein
LYRSRKSSSIAVSHNRAGSKKGFIWGAEAHQEQTSHDDGAGHGERLFVTVDRKYSKDD